MYHLAKRHFKKADPILHKAALLFAIPDVMPSEDLFRDIVWTIIGQQLSGKAADTIFNRFQKLFLRGVITPKKVLTLSDETIRACGISGAKMRAIRNLAEEVKSGRLDLKALPTLQDAEVLSELTKIKGIGPWTAEMILMFSLGRTDIFSVGDLGLKKGMMLLYGLKKFPEGKKLEKLTALWSPYRTYAARILWKVADAKVARVGRKNIRTVTV